MQQAAIGIDHGLLLQGNPDVGRIAFQSFAEESRWRDADYGDGVAFDDERGTHYGRIRGIGSLPDAMAEYGDRRSTGLVVLRSKYAATEGADPES
jgi:hypothetical protein